MNNRSGLTLIEVMATVAIIAILAAGVLPMSRMVYKRNKEIQLRNYLRVIRTALDEYKEMVDQDVIPDTTVSGYPKNLDVLVTGVQMINEPERKKKFLRRIPRDPMTEEGEWGLRAYSDEPDSAVWGGQDVYDVYTRSEKTAIDGSYYKDW